MPAKKSKNEANSSHIGGCFLQRKRKCQENQDSFPRSPNAGTEVEQSSIISNLGDKLPKPGSLSSSIFGAISSSSSSNAQTSLFESPNRWQKVSDERLRNNTDAMIAITDSSATKSRTDQNGNQSILTKENIIKARKNLSISKQAITLTNAITVHVPETNATNTLKEEEQNDVFRSISNMFTIQCDNVIRENGVVIIKSNNRLISQNLMQSLTSEAVTIEEQICTRLKEKGHIFHVPEGSAPAFNSCSSYENQELEHNTSFQYNEVASRCLGRLDIRYKMNEYPFNDDGIVSNIFIKPIVHSLLGKDAKLTYAGLILSFPLSADQPFHQDGTALFGEEEFPISQRLPPYALNVFIPLDDITEELGPTEFCIGSHSAEEAIKILSKLENGDKKGAKVIAPLLRSGDALIYDYRVCHRGTQNLAKKTRPMLYLMYARPWFTDHINFSGKKLFG